MATFKGFTENDFEHLRGSSWRSRNAIGGLISGTLKYQTGLPYRSWGVTRRLELHIASESAYIFANAQEYAKLFVYTHEHLAVGFYIEPPGNHSEENSTYEHWHNFHYKIQYNPAMQTALLCPMINEGLILTDFYSKDTDCGVLQGAYAFNQGRLQFWNPDTSIWTDTHVNYLIHQLATINPQEAAHLHLFSQLDRNTAIQMGDDVIKPILKILRSLLPLYEMTIE